jgi:hypothetical protein
MKTQSALIMTLAVAVLHSVPVHSKILFEGFYKIERGTTHVGYLAQRDNVDDKTGERTITYFAYREENGTSSYNGAKVIAKPSADMPFQPVRYTHWTSGNMKSPPLTEEGVFKAGKLNISVSDVSEAIRNDKTKKISQPQKLVAKFELNVQPDSFLSTFIPAFIATHGEAALKQNAVFTFNAFAEESRLFADGQCKVLRVMNTADAKRVARTFCRFPSDETEYFTFPDGQVLGYRMGDVSIYIAKNREDALGELKFPKDIVRKIFGDLPFGLENPVSKSLGKVDAAQLIKSAPALTDQERKINVAGATKLGRKKK